MLYIYISINLPSTLRSSFFLPPPFLPSSFFGPPLPPAMCSSHIYETCTRHDAEHWTFTDNWIRVSSLSSLNQAPQGLVRRVWLNSECCGGQRDLPSLLRREGCLFTPAWAISWEWEHTGGAGERKELQGQMCPTQKNLTHLQTGHSQAVWSQPCDVTSWAPLCRQYMEDLRSGALPRPFPPSRLQSGGSGLCLPPYAHCLRI